MQPLGDADTFWVNPFAAIAADAAAPSGPLAVAELELAPPVMASTRVLCVGLNYAAHVDEDPFTTPEYPNRFGDLAATGTPNGVGYAQTPHGGYCTPAISLRSTSKRSKQFEPRTLTGRASELPPPVKISDSK